MNLKKENLILSELIFRHFFHKYESTQNYLKVN